LVKHGKQYQKGKRPKRPKGDDEVSIDWETEDGGFETTMNVSQLRLSELEAQVSQLERENMNLLRELTHMKPDLDKKTEMLEIYDKRLKKFKNEFENYKLRSMKERRSNLKYASEKLILNLLEVLDNMDRAIENSKPDDKAEGVIDAVKQMRKQMDKILEKEGLKPIESNEKPFDPKYHEAMFQVKDDSYPDGTVIDEILKGYLLKEKILRASRVKVSQSDVNPAVKIEEPEEPEDEKEEEEPEEPKKEEPDKKAVKDEKVKERKEKKEKKEKRKKKEMKGKVKTDKKESKKKEKSEKKAVQKTKKPAQKEEEPSHPKKKKKKKVK
jgi:molecular chaperone GrpE